MSAEHDELSLVDELSDERLAAVLAEARRQHQPQPAAEWLPLWFGSFASNRTNLGRDHDDPLADGFRALPGPLGCGCVGSTGTARAWIGTSGCQLRRHNRGLQPARPR